MEMALFVKVLNVICDYVLLIVKNECGMRWKRIGCICCYSSGMCHELCLCVCNDWNVWYGMSEDVDVSMLMDCM